MYFSIQFGSSPFPSRDPHVIDLLPQYVLIFLDLICSACRGDAADLSHAHGMRQRC